MNFLKCISGESTLTLEHKPHPRLLYLGALSEKKDRIFSKNNFSRIYSFHSKDRPKDACSQ